MSPNPRPLVATIYNPHNQSKEALIAGFTARKAKFDRLFRDIREAPMTKPEQHYLIQGVRGMGKTTFLLRLAYEIENTPDVAERLIPIVFNEEEYGISSLADVWERTARYLEEADPTFAGLEDRMAAQYGGDDYERAALGTLLGTLREHGKKLILLIDNIGDLFRKFDDMENKRLREVLLTTSDLRLIGATPTLIEQTHDYSKPYFEFFKVIQLGGLNQEETNDLFLKLGEAYGTDAARELVEKRPGRIEALRRLTGGVIRTMVLLFEIMVENNTGSVFRDLNALIDRVTPLYKHRIDDLPAQQQKIVSALANAWDAASAKELAKVVRLESKVVSAQLKQLINNGIVEKVETKTKNNLYRLEERFFNIWYLMRFGRKTDQRALWLIRFFEEMFAGDAVWLQERLVEYISEIHNEKIDPESAAIVTNAYLSLITDEMDEYFLRLSTRLYLRKTGNWQLAEEVQLSSYEMLFDLISNKKYLDAVLMIRNFHLNSDLTKLDLAACLLLANQAEEAIFSYFHAIESQAVVELERLLNKHKIGLTSEATLMYNPGRITIIVVNYAGIYCRLGDLAADIILVYIMIGFRNSRKVIINSLQNFMIMEKDISSQVLVVNNIVRLINNNFATETENHKNPYEITKSRQNLTKAEVDSTGVGDFYMKLLLAKKQYHTAYNYFQQEEWQLKDRFKPLYYATMYFLQDEYPTEYLRMGPELAETVQDILAEVEQMAIDYA